MKEEVNPELLRSYCEEGTQQDVKAMGPWLSDRITSV